MSDSLSFNASRRRERLQTLVVDSREIAYQDVGSGPTVIFAHCSSASHSAWAPIVAALRSRYRVIAPDLLGYGQSERWPVNMRMQRWTDVGALLALAESVGEPVHLVGHSYGGAVALEAARILGPRARSVALIEPAAFHLLRLAGRLAEWHEITNVGVRMIEALRLRRDRRATALYMKYWVGRLRWWSMSPRLRRAIVETAGKVGAEFEAVLHLSRTLGDYTAIETPTRLVAGQRTVRPARAIIDELLGILPNSHLRIVKGAGHMSPITHAAAVGALVTDHLDSTEVRLARANQAGSGTVLHRRSIA